MNTPAAARPGALVWMTMAVVPALVLSGVHPYDRLTWYLEVFPVALVLPVLYLASRRFPLTPLLYWLVGLHCVILVIGGHYTYARVPLGFWMQDLLDLSRNHYDRVGHFAQGFIPAIAVREILIRHSPLKRGFWLAFLTVTTCLAISACYEFVEWWTSIVAGVAADQFLATQGDIWDTHWDMLMATIGAILSVLLLSSVHDRALARMDAA